MNWFLLLNGTRNLERSAAVLLLRLCRRVMLRKSAAPLSRSVNSPSPVANSESKSPTSSFQFQIQTSTQPEDGRRVRRLQTSATPHCCSERFSFYFFFLSSRLVAWVSFGLAGGPRVRDDLSQIELQFWFIPSSQVLGSKGFHCQLTPSGKKRQERHCCPAPAIPCSPAPLLSS